MNRLHKYFTENTVGENAVTIGSEVETSFVDPAGQPADVQATQEVMERLLQRRRFKVIGSKGNLITEISDDDGNRVLYELGRQNLEVACAPTARHDVVSATRRMLDMVYDEARRENLSPVFAPVLETEQDLIIVADERDQVWDQLDGRAALAPLAKISSVQFTVEVDPLQAITIINRLNASRESFLKDYHQEKIWRTYIRDSNAGYDPLRYGGPQAFLGLEHYCAMLAKHHAVQGPRLVPIDRVENLDIPLYIRSIWWYFRLRRYGNRLCIEVRPLARRGDDRLQDQFSMVLDIMGI